ncbi:hypothetical protein D7231_12300 [Streptomyces klenkii]|uniref:Uncharacterized protein n=1 Tax=Streptomyces klenkii TaxID=1420899 RepID=A0A3B0BNW5_9ACTN|nr:hypothetical protein [Streptomyces klenkii]RKN74612.1 hypothetical protein D7231_12300 [Streptomyces klenkii]
MYVETATSLMTHHHIRLQVTGETVRPGDVIDFGGWGYTVVEVVDFSGGRKGLRFDTGEALIVDSADELSAVRAIERR